MIKLQMSLYIKLISEKKTKLLSLIEIEHLSKPFDQEKNTQINPQNVQP